MKTNENLKNAFAGESQASRKYIASAEKAEQDGFPNVAKLFRAAADAETVHAKNHLKVMQGVKTTKENIQSAIEGETHEFESMYPEMIKAAEEEQNQEAKRSFSHASAAEKIHAELYKKALDSIESGKDLEEKQMNVCQICGHTVEGDAPDVCPVCGNTKDKFKKIE